MGIAIQLIISNVLIIAMGVFVFILINRLKKVKAAPEPAAPAPLINTEAAAAEKKELLKRLGDVEANIKKLQGSRVNEEINDRLAELGKSVNDLVNKVALNEKNVKEEIKNISSAGSGKTGKETDYKALIDNALKKEIDVLVDQQKEAASGANEEIICRINAIEQAFNKMAESIESGMNDMKKQYDDKIAKVEKSSGQTGEPDEKLLKKISEIEEKEKSNEKMVDFIDANLYEIKKRLDSLAKK